MVRQNLHSKISDSAKNHRKEVYYIHRPALERHIGDEKSLHNWCKKQIINSNGQEFCPTRVTNVPQPLLNHKLSINHKNSTTTYREECQCKFNFILLKTSPNCTLPGGRKTCIYKTSGFS